MKRTGFLLIGYLSLAMAASAIAGGHGYGPPDDARAMRWWNALNAEQMVAALYGDAATAEQTAAAQKPYAYLDGNTKALVNVAADELYGGPLAWWVSLLYGDAATAEETAAALKAYAGLDDGTQALLEGREGRFHSVGDWWETLDCRLMRVAAGDGNTADPTSPYCAHYPGSGAAKILSDAAAAQVDQVGVALLGLDYPGLFAPYNARAMRWWNALNAEQMVAALYGDAATAAQAAAAKKLYADLDGATKALVNVTADELYGTGGFGSVGDWWETLDCRLMRVAAGDGNAADPMSPYCAHYPGSGAAKILSDAARAHVDYVGTALLGRDDPGRFIPYVGMGTHGIGTMLEYVYVYEDGTTEPASALEYTGYGTHRGRDVLVVEFSLNPYDWPCSTTYLDLATGNRVACLDDYGEIDTEWIPHAGDFEFPVMEGMREPWEYAWQRDGDEHCDEVCEGLVHTWTVEACGIELEVEAGTFTVCRQSATANYDENIVWIEWFDPENNLVVKTRYADIWTEPFEVELSYYDLVE